MQHYIISSGSLSQQRGAVLIVGLIMLLLMTIVGLSSIRGSNLQELMAGSMRDRHVSFQAAEAGLRSGEIAVGGSVVPNTGGSVPGYSLVLDGGGSPAFWAEHNWNDASSVKVNFDLPVTEERARFVVEQLDVATVPGADGSTVSYDDMQKLPDIIFYRITSRGVGMTGNTETYLQSLYRRQ